MRKIILLLMLLLGSRTAYPQIRCIWTGNVDSTWNNLGNWSSGSVPTSIDTVFVENLSGKPYPVLNSDVTVARLHVQSSEIKIGSYTVTVGYIDTYWSTIHSSGGKIKAIQIDPFFITSVDGDIIMECEFGRLTGGGVFDGDVEIRFFPNNSNLLVGTNNLGFHFKGRTKFLLDGTGFMGFSTLPNTITFDKKVEFDAINPGAGVSAVNFPTRGSTINFKDSVNFFLSQRTTVTLRSFVNFEGVTSST